MRKITLYDYLKISGGMDCVDNVFDMVIYFDTCDEVEDKYDEFITFVEKNVTPISKGCNTISNTELLSCTLSAFCKNYLHAFAKFSEENCSIEVAKYNDIDDQVWACLRILEDMAIGNYSESQYAEFMQLVKTSSKRRSSN